MAKVNPTIAAIVVILIVVAGVGIVLAVNGSGDKADTNKNGSKTSTSSTKAATGKGLNPTDVIKKISDYKDKSITLTGEVHQAVSNPGPNQTATTQYYVVGTDAKPGAVLLSFDKSGLKPSDYADPTPDGSVDQKIANKGPFDITGTVAQPDKNGPFILTITAISKSK